MSEPTQEQLTLAMIRAVTNLERIFNDVAEHEREKIRIIKDLRQSAVVLIAKLLVDRITDAEAREFIAEKYIDHGFDIEPDRLGIWLTDVHSEYRAHKLTLEIQAKAESRRHD